MAELAAQPKFTAYVSNLEFSTTEEELRAFFPGTKVSLRSEGWAACCGLIQIFPFFVDSIWAQVTQVHLYKRFGKFFAFVDFETDADLQAALPGAAGCTFVPCFFLIYCFF
jgi:hypothetical protein